MMESSMDSRKLDKSTNAFSVVGVLDFAIGLLADVYRQKFIRLAAVSRSVFLY